MKYKTGDVVEIRDFQDMKLEYGWENIFKESLDNGFDIGMVALSNEMVTIKKVINDYYTIEGEPWFITDEMIK